MTADCERAAEVRAWLTRAAADVRAAEHDQTAMPPLAGDSVFHAQQAIEKCLKAFLTSHDRRFRKTHDLVELGQGCVEVDRSLEDVLREAAPMTEYAWRYRYPGDVEEPMAEEVEEALKSASAPPVAFSAPPRATCRARSPLPARARSPRRRAGPGVQ